MNKKELEKCVPGPIFDHENNKWATFEELENIKFGFFFGDDGGDTFFEMTKTEKELEKKLSKYLKGDTGCDFDTSLYLIIKNGKKCDFSTKVSLT